MVEYLLADEGPGDGGVAVIPGSHKANLPCPQSIKGWERYKEHVVDVQVKAGDAVILYRDPDARHSALERRPPAKSVAEQVERGLPGVQRRCA